MRLDLSYQLSFKTLIFKKYGIAEEGQAHEKWE